MALEDSKMWAEARRLTKDMVSEGSNAASVRANRHGELVVQSQLGGKLVQLCDEGAYYVATNPTPGTGIAGIAAADGYDATEALIHMRNDAASSADTRIYLDYLKLQITAAGTNGTNQRYVSILDTGASRYTSGGSAITEVSPNMANGTASSATIHFGALVTGGATTSARNVGHGLLRNVIAVIGDTITFDFGGTSPVPNALARAGTAICDQYVKHAPVVLGPSDIWHFSIFAASQTVGQGYEFELGYWER
jgi:hypothetical protein